MIKKLSREFSTREKVLLLIMAFVILGAVYYLLIFQPVAEGMKNARLEMESLEEQLAVADVKAMQIINMRAEMDNLESQGLTPTFMPSYNAEKQELDFLHTILSADTEGYQVNFTQVTRNSNQIRRNFNLSFSAKNYKIARSIISKLETGDIRCLVGDMTIASSEKNNILNGEITVSCVATFYETMYEGIEDADLPADSSQGGGNSYSDSDY
jgi:hypothetical protein